MTGEQLARAVLVDGNYQAAVRREGDALEVVLAACRSLPDAIAFARTLGRPVWAADGIVGVHVAELSLTQEGPREPRWYLVQPDGTLLSREPIDALAGPALTRLRPEVVMRLRGGADVSTVEPAAGEDILAASDFSASPSSDDQEPNHTELSAPSAVLRSADSSWLAARQWFDLDTRYSIVLEGNLGTPAGYELLVDATAAVAAAVTELPIVVLVVGSVLSVEEFRAQQEAAGQSGDPQETGGWNLLADLIGNERVVVIWLGTTAVGGYPVVAVLEPGVAMPEAAMGAVAEAMRDARVPPALGMVVNAPTGDLLIVDLVAEVARQVSPPDGSDQAGRPMTLAWDDVAAETSGVAAAQRWADRWGGIVDAPSNGAVSSESMWYRFFPGEEWPAWIPVRLPAPQWRVALDPELAARSAPTGWAVDGIAAGLVLREGEMALPEYADRLVVRALLTVVVVPQPGTPEQEVIRVVTAVVSRVSTEGMVTVLVWGREDPPTFAQAASIALGPGYTINVPAVAWEVDASGTLAAVDGSLAALNDMTYSDGYQVDIYGGGESDSDGEGYWDGYDDRDNGGDQAQLPGAVVRVGQLNPDELAFSFDAEVGISAEVAAGVRAFGVNFGNFAAARGLLGLPLPRIELVVYERGRRVGHDELLGRIGVSGSGPVGAVVDVLQGAIREGASARLAQSTPPGFSPLTLEQIRSSTGVFAWDVGSVDSLGPFQVRLRGVNAGVPGWMLGMQYQAGLFVRAWARRPGPRDLFVGSAEMFDVGSAEYVFRSVRVASFGDRGNAGGVFAAYDVARFRRAGRVDLPVVLVFRLRLRFEVGDRMRGVVARVQEAVERVNEQQYLLPGGEQFVVRVDVMEGDADWRVRFASAGEVVSSVDPAVWPDSLLPPPDADVRDRVHGTVLAGLLGRLLLMLGASGLDWAALDPLKHPERYLLPIWALQELHDVPVNVVDRGLARPWWTQPVVGDVWVVQPPADVDAALIPDSGRLPRVPPGAVGVVGIVRGGAMMARGEPNGLSPRSLLDWLSGGEHGWLPQGPTGGAEPRVLVLYLPGHRFEASNFVEGVQAEIDGRRMVGLPVPEGVVATLTGRVQTWFHGIPGVDTSESYTSLDAALAAMREFSPVPVIDFEREWRRLVRDGVIGEINVENLARLLLDRVGLVSGEGVPPYRVAGEPEVEPAVVGLLGPVLFAPVDPDASVLVTLEAVRSWLRRWTVREVSDAGARVPVRLADGWDAPVVRLPATESDRARYVFTIQAPGDVDDSQQLWVNNYADGFAAVPLLDGSAAAFWEAAIPVGAVARVVIEPGVLNSAGQVAGQAPGSLLWSPVGARWLTVAEYARWLPDAVGGLPVVVLAGHLRHADLDAPFITGLMSHAIVVSRVPQGSLNGWWASVKDDSGQYRIDGELARLLPMVTGLAPVPSLGRAVRDLMFNVSVEVGSEVVARRAFERAPLPRNNNPTRVFLRITEREGTGMFAGYATADAAEGLHGLEVPRRYQRSFPIGIEGQIVEVRLVDTSRLAATQEASPVPVIDFEREWRSLVRDGVIGENSEENLARLLLDRVGLVSGEGVPPYRVEAEPAVAGEPEVEPVVCLLGPVLFAPVDPDASAVVALEAVRSWLRRWTVREVSGAGARVVPVRLADGWDAPVVRLPATESDRARYVFTIRAPGDVDGSQQLWVNNYADGFAAVPLPDGSGAALWEAAIPVGAVDRVVIEPGMLNFAGEVDGQAPGSLLWSPVEARWLTVAEYARWLPDAAGGLPVVVLAGHMRRADQDAPFITGLMSHAIVVSPMQLDSLNGWWASVKDDSGQYRIDSELARLLPMVTGLASVPSLGRAVRDLMFNVSVEVGSEVVARRAFEKLRSRETITLRGCSAA